MTENSTQAEIRDSYRTKCDALEHACQLTLLFHSGSPWDYAKQNEWRRLMDSLLTTDDPRIVGANGNGTWDAKASKYEATTKNLCTAIRAALSV